MATKRSESAGSLGLDGNEDILLLLLLLQVPLPTNEETIVLKQMMDSYRK